MLAVSHALPLLLLLAAAPLALAGTHAAGLTWLEENKAKPGVITLPSGLQYKVLKHGSGVFHPSANSPCECHYAGTLIDGTEFDSSYKRGEPTTFAPNQVSQGVSVLWMKRSAARDYRGKLACGCAVVKPSRLR
jgi:hypothetical protein